MVHPVCNEPRVLFVENDATFAGVVQTKFLRDYRITCVSSVKAALAAVTFHSYPVVLVDYDLDDGKGTQLVLRLRERGYRGHIIAISAKPEGNAALLECGANAVCGKLDFSNGVEWSLGK